MDENKIAINSSGQISITTSKRNFLRPLWCECSLWQETPITCAGTRMSSTMLSYDMRLRSLTLSMKDIQLSWYVLTRVVRWIGKTIIAPRLQVDVCKEKDNNTLLHMHAWLWDIQKTSILICYRACVQNILETIIVCVRRWCQKQPLNYNVGITSLRLKRHISVAYITVKPILQFLSTIDHCAFAQTIVQNSLKTIVYSVLKRQSKIYWTFVDCRESAQEIHSRHFRHTRGMSRMKWIYYFQHRCAWLKKLKLFLLVVIRVSSKKMLRQETLFHLFASSSMLKTSWHICGTVCNDGMLDDKIMPARACTQRH